MAFAPRGRWSLLRYSNTALPRVSDRADIYTVVQPGSGETQLAAGDLVLVEPSKLAQVGGGYAYGQIDNGGILAKWNDTFAEPVVLFGTVYATIHEVHSPNDGVISYFDDARVLRVLAVDPAITDIAVDDMIIVPRRFLRSVGQRAEEDFITYAESIVAKEV